MNQTRNVFFLVPFLLICQLSGSTLAADDKPTAQTGVAANTSTPTRGEQYQSVYQPALGRAATAFTGWLQDAALSTAIARELKEREVANRFDLMWHAPPGNRSTFGQLYEVIVDRGLESARALRSVAYRGMGTNPVDVLAGSLTEKYLGKAPLSPWVDSERSGFVWITMENNPEDRLAGRVPNLLYATFYGSDAAALREAAQRVLARSLRDSEQSALRSLNQVLGSPPFGVPPTSTTGAPPASPAGSPTVAPPSTSSGPPKPHPGADGSRERAGTPEKVIEKPKERTPPAERQRTPPERGRTREITGPRLGMQEKDAGTYASNSPGTPTATTMYKVRERNNPPVPEVRWMVIAPDGRIVGYFAQRQDAQSVVDILAAALAKAMAK